jgi:DNA polymerase (family 10)
MCESIGNIDLLAVGEQAAGTLALIGTLDAVAEVLELQDNAGRYMLHQGVALRVVVAAPERAGSELVRLTGSAAHVGALGTLAEAATEEACYAALGLPWIAPELREDRGELAAARAGSLPHLITVEDLKGDLHLHSTWSDGKATPLEMAQAAAQRGYEYLAITDHSGGLGIANGLDAARLGVQIQEIRGLAGSSPVRLLAGSEVEVHRDGRLDFEDALLDQLDLVVASLHSGLRQDAQTITARICATLRKREVDIVAHATGRLIDRRQGATYDWTRVFEAARESGTALEINSDPARLDLNEKNARAAHEQGVLLTVDSDAHRPESLDLVRYGIGIARRAWVEPQRVVNTWELEEVLAWLLERRTPAR